MKKIAAAVAWLSDRQFAAAVGQMVRDLRGEWRLFLIHRSGCRRAQKYRDASALKLHLGCGATYKPDWLNIDTYSGPGCTPDLLLDLRRPLPLSNGSCREIYSEHFFEHLPFPQAAVLNLSESRRLLEPGGKLTIGVPDPGPVLKAYLQDEPHEYFDYYMNHPTVSRHLHSRMEGVNWLFRQGGEHHFIHDFGSLEKMLLAAGFCDIRQRDFDPSTDSPARQCATLYVEAERGESHA